MYGYDRSQCEGCMLRREWVRERVRDRLEERANLGLSSMRVSGGHLFDLDPSESPIWGDLQAPLSAEGQAWMICGPDGTGKTSTACQYLKARLGLASQMVDLPVKRLAYNQSVYYFAADRPVQAMLAFMRGVGPELREMLDRRLFVHRGPPPYRLSGDRGQRWLVEEIEETGAGVVVLDSRKDFGSTTNADEVAGFNTAVQLLVAAGVEVLVLADPNERRRNGPPVLADVSGHGPVYNGMGSVVFLEGRPSATLVAVTQIKAIHEMVPPFRVVHDHAAGHSERAPEGDRVGRRRSGVPHRAPGTDGPLGTAGAGLHRCAPVRLGSGRVVEGGAAQRQPLAT